MCFSRCVLRLRSWRSGSILWRILPLQCVCKKKRSNHYGTRSRICGEIWDADCYDNGERRIGAYDSSKQDVEIFGGLTPKTTEEYLPRFLMFIQAPCSLFCAKYIRKNDSIKVRFHVCHVCPQQCRSDETPRRCFVKGAS